jgi:hypothetical protein
MQGIACSEDRRKGQQRVEHRVGWPRTARHLRNTALLPMLNRLRMYRVVVWWYSQSSGVNSVEMDRPLDTSSCPAPRPAKRSAQLRPTIQVTLAQAVRFRYLGPQVLVMHDSNRVSADCGC